MKIKKALISTFVVATTLMAIAIAVTSYRLSNEKAGLQKLVDATKPDISSEHGIYGHYRIYTGMLICEDCDSIAARLILKSESGQSHDGVATFETTKIFAGSKPVKQPIQKALWTIMKGNTRDPNAQYISLFSEKNTVANFLLNNDDLTAPWKIIIEGTTEGEPLSTSENRIGKLVLITEGVTTP